MGLVFVLWCGKEVGGHISEGAVDGYASIKRWGETKNGCKGATSEEIAEWGGQSGSYRPDALAVFSHDSVCPSCKGYC